MDTLQANKLVISEDKMANSIEMSIRDEDHTLGNALVSELQKKEGVMFAAYKIPHPLQNILKVKVAAENTEDKPVELVKSCLDDLIRDCETMLTHIYK
ncbi:DNA-directed RNA polymerase II subunit RPB11 [Nematocida minor]|uniref:DNA-directed RNA polymerase II subunit RPB11 n=1 Tax=Nematocida minor TaxID=1912983 RepID=UPI00221EE93A|nr:DNA-directed RNA polymerase II subunit RPB11 [Nematocida minor]KAI5190200.1 DNA-directed RNA polymerase II subunit RPB11 [Nematocida minor]